SAAPASPRRRPPSGRRRTARGSPPRSDSAPPALRDTAARPARARRRAGAAPWGGGVVPSVGLPRSCHRPRKGPALHRVEHAPEDVALELERRHGPPLLLGCAEPLG